jgi:magnesium-transporting ATPase (P-type)
MKIPLLYQDSKNQTMLNYKTFLMTICYAIYQAAMISLITYSTFSGNYFNIFGYPMDYWKIGLAVVTSIFFTQLIVIFLHVDSHNFVSLSYIFISLNYFIVIFLLYGVIPAFKLDPVFDGIIQLLKDPNYYFVVLFSTFIAILPSIFWKLYHQTVSSSHSNFSTYIRELETKRRWEKKNFFGEIDDEFYNDILKKIDQKNHIFEELHIETGDDTSSENHEESSLMNPKKQKKK